MSLCIVRHRTLGAPQVVQTLQKIAQMRQIVQGQSGSPPHRRANYCDIPWSHSQTCSPAVVTSRAVEENSLRKTSGMAVSLIRDSFAQMVTPYCQAPWGSLGCGSCPPRSLRSDCPNASWLRPIGLRVANDLHSVCWRHPHERERSPWPELRREGEVRCVEPNR